jgi:hypothetical protein
MFLSMGQVADDDPLNNEPRGNNQEEERHALGRQPYMETSGNNEPGESNQEEEPHVLGRQPYMEASEDYLDQLLHAWDESHGTEA